MKFDYATQVALEVLRAIGDAWALHRNNQNEEAIAQFRSILDKHPDLVDPNYGLGLAYRAVGNKEQAVQAFQRAYDLASQTLREIRAETEAEGVAIATNLGRTDDDRFMMLIRMLYQRLREHGVDVSPTLLEG
ncbi:MAG: tetratricopeptide repeat protein [Chloroflexota bacterium]